MALILLPLVALASAAGSTAQAPSPPMAPPVFGAPSPLSPEIQAKVNRSKYAGQRFLTFMKDAGSLAKAARFSGEMGMAYNYRTRSAAADPAALVLAREADGSIRPADRVWPLASITKQIVAVLVMQEVSVGRINLDTNLGSYVPSLATTAAGKVTVRQLLQHQSGLPNPDDTSPDPDGVPAFYKPGSTAGSDPLGFCSGPAKGSAGGSWSYNNCDFILAGVLLEAVTGKDWRELVQQRIAIPNAMVSLGAFPTNNATVTGKIGTKPEPLRALDRYGASGALYGTALELLRFDMALLSGKILANPALAQMWDGKAELGYIALGQWSFPATLKGCLAPVRIVERRGAIGGIQVRNYILPELEIAVVLFSDQGEFEFGEIWQGTGFAHDMLSLAACPKGAS